jgi:phytanoyl-CoA hydroxylase
VLVRQLFAPSEAPFYRERFTRLREQDSYPKDDVPPDPASQDPLRRYPRLIHMHHWDEAALRWLLEPRLNQCLTSLLGNEPFAVQTMLYFKPPGARGQAPHQDNYYLRVQPGTCIAAWMALDPCDEANGCLEVVPGSHRWPLLCTVPADTTFSFIDIQVPLPNGSDLPSMLMGPGDVLFFNGSLVHGSRPNTTPDRFRRTLIGHYMQAEAERVAKYYNPVLRMDGTPVQLELSQRGGSCGVWVDQPGGPAIQMSGVEPAQLGPHEHFPPV